MNKITIINISLFSLLIVMGAFVLSSCGVLVPNSATIVLAIEDDGQDTSDIEYKDITFVGFTENKKASVKEGKESEKITLNWFGNGTKNFTINFKAVVTTGGTAVETPTSKQVYMTNFEDIKYYLFRKSGSEKFQREKL